jgi:hypothetical protein
VSQARYAKQRDMVEKELKRDFFGGPLRAGEGRAESPPQYIN